MSVDIKIQYVRKVIKLRKTIFIIFIILVMLPLSHTMVKIKSQPIWHHNTTTIETSKSVFKISEKKPIILLWLKDDSNDITYFVKFINIVEFEDTDGDRKFDLNDKVLALAPLAAKAPLSGGKLEWQIFNETYNYGDYSELRVIIKKNVSIVRTGGGMGPPTSLNTSIMFNLSFFDKDIESIEGRIRTDLDFKLSISIKDWPWHSENSQIAITLTFGNWDNPTSKMFMEKTKSSTKRGVKNSVIFGQKNAKYGAHFTYVDNAETINNTVKVHYNEHNISTFNSKMQLTEKGFKVFSLSFDHFNGVLVYDPIIGLITSETEVFFPQETNLIYLTVIATLVMAITLAIFLYGRK